MGEILKAFSRSVQPKDKPRRSNEMPHDRYKGRFGFVPNHKMPNLINDDQPSELPLSPSQIRQFQRSQRFQQLAEDNAIFKEQLGKKSALAGSILGNGIQYDLLNPISRLNPTSDREKIRHLTLVQAARIARVVNDSPEYTLDNSDPRVRQEIQTIARGLTENYVKPLFEPENPTMAPPPIRPPIPSKRDQEAAKDAQRERKKHEQKFIQKKVTLGQGTLADKIRVKLKF